LLRSGLATQGGFEMRKIRLRLLGWLLVLVAVAVAGGAPFPHTP